MIDSERPPLVESLGYVALNVPDLNRSLWFYRRIGHLQVVEQRRSKAFLTGGSEHHWITLEQNDGPVGVRRIGFHLASDDALDLVSDKLAEHRIAAQPIGGLHEEGIDRGVRFVAPDGVEIDVYCNMVSLPTAPSPGMVQLDRLLHAVWLVTDPTAAHDFYAEVLGFRASDWVEDVAVFMRSSNRYHHSMGILKAPLQRAAKLDHICILVPTIDDVVRARNIALDEGLELRQDLVRHAASGSISTYIADPDLGIQVEFCVDHCRIDDPQHRPRRLEASPVTVDLWLQGTKQDPHSSNVGAERDAALTDFTNLVA